MMADIELIRVKYLPRHLEPGALYVSEEFQVAGHLCACGCGNKVITPLGGTEWTFTENAGKATLYPSIGNWELPCRSHYWINKGAIVWSYQWTDEQIKAGREAEEKRRLKYFKNISRRKKKKLLSRLWHWIFPLINSEPIK